MRGSVLAGLAVLLALLGAVPAVSQVARPSLTGQVLDAATRAPVRAAVVELAKSHRRVLTDSLGRFAFTSVPAQTQVLVASALGYQNAVGSAEAGSAVMLLLEPSPVPLKALVALTRPSSRSIRGATVKVFGRDDLLAAGDIPVGQFVNWKAHFHHRLCRVPAVRTSALLGIPPVSGESTGMASPGDATAGGIVTDCIVGAHGSFGPYVVMVDGQPLTYSDELWARKAWDLGRVEVVYQRSANDAGFGSGFRRPFAFVRLYTLGYLSQAAARVSHLCDHVTSADTVANAYLASLCGP